MKTTLFRHGKPGFVSYVLVLSTGMILTVLLLATYKHATNAQKVQSTVQLRNDYSEKEDAILRSIVALTPNRAIRAMQNGSNATSTSRNPLRWRNIFTESLNLANARTSVSSDVLSSLAITNAKKGNVGDSALGSPNRVFHPISGVNDNLDTSWASSGINRSLGTGFPVPLTTSNTTTIDRDRTYPIITKDKQYGTLAQSGVGLPVADYPDFNLLTYPQINFGYAQPGAPFVAKRNWWAFGLDLADHDDDKTYVARPRREFVLSIYEIPSQLAISADSFMSLGQFSSGEAWQNVTIDGGIFAGQAEVLGETALSALSSRRGMDLSSDSTIGGQSFNQSPFTPGVRESYQVTEGEFFPVSLASESGRVAFIPINRGEEFFDRFAHADETNTVSPTTWNNYSVGALQCAMRLDITKVVSETNMQPAELRFEYKLPDGSSRSETWPLIDNGVQTSLPAGYTYLGSEYGGETFTFTEPVDLAYGYPGLGYSFKLGFTGSIKFNNDTFGDPAVGQPKEGFWRPSPFRPKRIESGKDSGKYCIKVLPERIAEFLTKVGAADTSINHSLAVNVDYRNIGPTYPTRPEIPGDDHYDYGVILEECKDLTSFTRGFSLVTNLRVYFGDDFNTEPATPPAGYTPPTGTYYPPVSIFCPEKRYGVEEDPLSLELEGQIGSLAKADKINVSDTDPTKVRPLDSITQSGAELASNRVTVNLKPITHPAELPPITMMNWLVVLEERRQEFIGN